MLTLREEYIDLLPDFDKAKVVANNSYLIDEFLCELNDKGNLDLSFEPLNGKVLFHGHCHQKALASPNASATLMNLVPNAEVEILDAGCCGMAGAFGFEKEHYAISMEIGNRVLFPAVRQNVGSSLVVTGVSCRQQVQHGTDVVPKHLVEFLAGQMKTL